MTFAGLGAPVEAAVVAAAVAPADADVVAADAVAVVLPLAATDVEEAWLEED